MGFCISYNETHWSNEAETLRLLDDVIKPYVENARSALDLPIHKALLTWDAFKAQSMDTSTAATCPRHKWIGVDRWKKSLSMGITLYAFQKL